MPLSIPAVIFGVGFLMTYTTKPLVLYGTPWVLILVYVTLMIPFATRMLLGAMAALGDFVHRGGACVGCRRVADEPPDRRAAAATARSAVRPR